MGMVQEFKEFAVKGNMMDMAIGIVMGTAFGKIISALVEKIVMPFTSLFTGGTDFTSMSVPLGEGEDAAQLGYGAFIQALIDFILIALAIFVVVKMINTAKKRFEAEKEEEETVAEPSEEVKLLQEIRDSLAKG